MPIITLPDGSQKTFDAPISVADVAASIGAGLAKAALAGRVNDVLVDTSHVITDDAELSIITAKDDEGLEIIRHSTAHLLAQAVKQLYPGAQVTIGPVIEDGFYYDFAFTRAFTPEDLEKIEARMQELADQQIPITRSDMSRQDAIAFFKETGEHYKVKVIEELVQGDQLSFYHQDDFTDLCRGPHVPHTGHLKAFKLTKLAGAYWRGDANNEMLQRIYGTAWADKKALKAYLTRIEEAEKRDHRRLAKQLHLFHLQEEAPGMVFWHERGWIVYRLIEQYLRDELARDGYHEVRTPQVMSRRLWEKSGHWDKFHDEMFITETESHPYAVKPMSCPGHIQVFNQGLKSYRDLPLRLAEFGNCHRCEPSGALHGLMRLRQFTQDDGHIFCTEDQIQAEVGVFIDSLYKVYRDMGFDEVILKLSTRPDNRVGSDDIWDKAEQALAQSLDSKGLNWEICPGEGAFYGPKIEFSLKDCLGRTWQCGTMQVDFSMPQRLDAHYVAEDGSKQVPVMLHRAILGSFERFIGILIEHYAGHLPLWLAPVQAAVLNITDSQAEYAENVAKQLTSRGFRVNSDLRNEKINFKIREHTLQRVPYLLVVGDREVASQAVAVRTQSGVDLGTMSLDELVERFNTDVDRKGRVA